MRSTYKSKNRRFLLVGAFDSSLKWGAFLEKEANERGFWMDYCVLIRKSDKGRAQITREQWKASGAKTRPFSTTAEYLVESGKIFDYDAVFMIVDGRSTATLNTLVDEAFSKGESETRPVMVAGYAGLVLERWLGGMADRIDSDFLCVNSKQDYELMREALPMFGRKDEALICSGLTIFGGVEKRPSVNFPPKVIVFAAQPTVPALRRERLYLLKRLMDYARRYPDSQVLFKPRHKPGEKAFNKEKFSYLELLEKWFAVEDIPQNFAVVYEPMPELISKADLVLSVSSTAAPEAWFYGVPFATIADFGFSDIYGGPFFASSNRLMTFDQIENHEFQDVDDTWVERQLSIADNPSGEILNRVESKIAEWEGDPSGMQMPTTPYRHAYEKMMSTEITISAAFEAEETQVAAMQIAKKRLSMKQIMVSVATRAVGILARLPGMRGPLKAIAASSLISVRRRVDPAFDPDFLPQIPSKRRMVLRLANVWDGVQRLPVIGKIVPFIATVCMEGLNKTENKRDYR
ncbi:DUF6716 putative glycosyltransferase [Hirschia litorea]|uniref:DUF6716 putative glycosyltransferase n=1 Tax=Hirschia litorea TaxID=1199156 RepID=A0ABW2IQ89_9PROT